MFFIMQVHRAGLRPLTIERQAPDDSTAIWRACDDFPDAHKVVVIEKF